MLKNPLSSASLLFRLPKMAAVVDEADAPGGEKTATPVPAAAEEKAPAAEAAETPITEAGGEGAPDEAESTAVFKPLVQLEEVEVVSGEEDEEILMGMRGKLFQYTETMLNKGSGNKQWIERGVGEIKLLK